MPKPKLQQDVTKADQDLTLLCPRFYQRLSAAIADSRRAGYPIAVFEGWRSPERQDWLYAAGRTREGRIITKAKGWQSAHQLSLAADVAVFKDGVWSWDFDFVKLCPIFRAHDLEWGGPNDAVHWQMLGGIRTQDAATIAQTYGLQQLWKEVYAKIWRSEGKTG
jgi:hypothetical protein